MSKVVGSGGDTVVVVMPVIGTVTTRVITSSAQYCSTTADLVPVIPVAVAPVVFVALPFHELGFSGLFVCYIHRLTRADSRVP